MFGCWNPRGFAVRLAAAIVAATLLAAGSAHYVSAQQLQDIEQHFTDLRGQLQVGGPFAGVEFHRSRPAPSRISFYAPVANSIDLSTDYWRRDESMPFSIVVTFDGRRDTLSNLSAPYYSTPASARFELQRDGYDAQMLYRFSDQCPCLVFTLKITSRLDESDAHPVVIETNLQPVLRTSHTYAFRYPAEVGFDESGDTFVAHFEDADTGPAVVFISNVGHEPDPASPDTTGSGRFVYSASLAPGESLEVNQLIGSSSPDQYAQDLSQSRKTWQAGISEFESRVADNALLVAPFHITDTTLAESAIWSKALLQADKHYLDGHIVPMPCPAQYNFFFTHDLLLTDLGAVFFDSTRVRRDLLYVRSLAGADSLLPHAYYWKDDHYQTEFAGADNWNHFWFVIMASSYLKHSGDVETVRRLWPVMTKSVELMLTNEHEGLMQAERPDWWDIGHVYGARAYTTTLAIRALRSYVYTGIRLGLDDPKASGYLEVAARLQKNLSEQLWDDEAGYLLNRIEGDEVDRHYYSGSQLAAAFGFLSPERMNRLLDTARDQLLDPDIGIRNAMPPDFHELTDLYRFQEGEVGAPYQYMNGGVWPQGTAWYLMGLLTARRADDARAALKRYLTIDGIRNSPNGQPAFFEYRNADPGSAEYGRIDKTTFLWAGGWYLYVLYQLLGVREDEWNISFDAGLPTDLGDVSYSMLIDGREVSVDLTGTGDFFRRIEVDGKLVNSAIVASAKESIRLHRGTPETPYLRSASAIVESVSFAGGDRELEVIVKGEPGQRVEIQAVSPTPVVQTEIDSVDRSGQGLSRNERDGVEVYTLSWQLKEDASTIRLRY